MSQVVMQILTAVDELKRWPTALLNVVAEFRDVFQFVCDLDNRPHVLAEGKVQPIPRFSHTHMSCVISLGAFLYILHEDGKVFEKVHRQTNDVVKLSLPTTTYMPRKHMHL